MLKFLPDRYATEPELWLANQTGHMALGALGAVIFCGVWLQVSGEFPYRSTVFAMLLLIYGVGVELLGQKWQGADTIEDTLFVVGWGAGPILYAFHEVKAGSGEFYGNIADIEPFIYLAGFHLALGTVFRLWNRCKERSG